jgi:hypothetical protein
VNLVELKPKPNFDLISGILKILPQEVLEHIMSFCAGKNLLSLSETNTIFNSILSDSKKLTRKLVYRIQCPSFDKHPVNRNLIRNCLISRNYTSLIIREFSSCINPMPVPSAQWNNNQVKMLLTVADAFTEIEHLKLDRCFFTQSEFENLMKIFIPRLKSLKLHETYSHHVDDINFVWTDQEFFNSNSLEELSITGSVRSVDRNILQSLKKCANIKKLLIEKLPYNIVGDYQWQLEEIHIEDLDEFDDDFERFLRNQKKLKVLKVDELESGVDFAVEILHSLDKLVFNNKHDTVDLSLIPHHLLKKIWLKIDCKHSGYRYNQSLQTTFRYAPELVEDPRQMELNILEFVSNAGQDVKYIDSVVIGKSSWTLHVALTEAFIKSMIQLLPEMKYLKIFSASDLSHILQTVVSSGRDFKEIKIIAQNGNAHLKCKYIRV